MSGLVIQEQISLADKNWFRTGGPAAYFAQPNSPEQFHEAVHFAHEKKLPTFVLGHGANVLISDAGFPGLVIRPQLHSIQITKAQSSTILHAQSPNRDHVLVTAGAGVSLDALIAHCLERNIIGLEEFSGIPGTVGGAVFINAHYFEFLLERFLVEAEIIDAQSGCTERVNKAWFEFGYNQSRLAKHNHYLISATFALQHTDPVQAAYATGRRTEIIRHRTRRYPTSGTCGSFFRNFFEHELIDASQANRSESTKPEKNPVTYVAYYLDKVGVKGSLSHNDACVSHQHANMLINRGSAQSADLIAVARQMQKRVYEQFRLIPQPECRLIGFETNPLEHTNM